MICTYNNKILPTTNTIFHADHPTRGSGVMLAVKSDILCKLIKSPSDLEVVCVRLNLSHPITCCVKHTS